MQPPEEPTGKPTGNQTTLQPAGEINIAVPLSVAKRITIEPAVEIDTAMSLQILGPTVVVAYAVVTHDGYHLPDHHDLVAYGTELALIVALIFVGGRLVAHRLFGFDAGDT